MPFTETRVINSQEIADVTQELLIHGGQVISGEALEAGKQYRLQIRWRKEPGRTEENERTEVPSALTALVAPAPAPMAV